MCKVVVYYCYNTFDYVIRSLLRNIFLHFKQVRYSESHGWEYNKLNYSVNLISQFMCQS